MKTEDIFDMLNGIDEKLIEKAGEDLENYRHSEGKVYYVEEKSGFSWKRASAAIVCAAAVMLGGFFVVKNANRMVVPADDPSSDYSDTDSSSSDAEPYNFYFDLGMHGDSEFNPEREKKNNFDSAQVNANNGFVTENSFIYFAVYSKDHSDREELVSESRKVENLRRSIALDYTEERRPDSMYCLHAATGYYDARVSGTWIP